MRYSPSAGSVISGASSRALVLMSNMMRAAEKTKVRANHDRRAIMVRRIERVRAGACERKRVRRATLTTVPKVVEG